MKQVLSYKFATRVEKTITQDLLVKKGYEELILLFQNDNLQLKLYVKTFDGQAFN